MFCASWLTCSGWTTLNILASWSAEGETYWCWSCRRPVIARRMDTRVQTINTCPSFLIVRMVSPVYFIRKTLVTQPTTGCLRSMVSKLKRTSIYASITPNGKWMKSWCDFGIRIQILPKLKNTRSLKRKRCPIKPQLIVAYWNVCTWGRVRNDWCLRLYIDRLLCIMIVLMIGTMCMGG